VSGDTKGAIGFYSKAIEVKPGHIDALVARAGLYLDTAQLDAATADITAARKADPKDPRSAYMAAMLAERAGQKAKARDALNEVTNLLDPLPLDYIKFRPQILMLGGMSHYALGQFEKAKPYLEATLRQDPSSPVSKMLADIYLRERRIDLNVEMLETYLRTSPNDLQALLQLATSTLSLGRNARAGQIAEAALKLKDDATARAVLGTSLVNSGQVEKGVAELEKALKLDPRQLPAGILLTNLYLASAQSRPAVDSARNLVKHHANNAGAHNLLGLALLGAGEEPQSRAAFEQALAIDAKHVDAQLNLSRLDTNRRDFPAALKHLNAVIGRDDKNLEAILETARHFHVRGQPDEALKWLQRAEDLSGNRLEPGLRMVEFQLERGRADLADQAVSKLRSKAPEALLVLLAQARVQLALGDAQASRSTLARASTFVSFDAAALTQIADLQVRASDVAGAAHSLDKALSSRPGHLRARVMRSNVHLLQGQADKAEQLARDVLKTDPTSGLGDSLLGDVARHRGQMAAAIEAYRKAHERQGTTQSVLALFNAQQATQPAAASSLIERWLKTHPNDTTAWRALGDMRARSGDWAAAKPVYEKLAQLQPRDAEVLNNFANVLVNAKDPRALAVAEQALALKPGTPHIIGTTGWAAFQAGQQQKALQLLRDARLRDPANASTRYFLAAALAKQGLQGEARQELSAAVQQGGAAFPYASEAAALQRSLN
jgi:putative PEP-CTERM system TPR-repeat lipoprotein